jgi:hypothetical protein
LCRPPVEPLLPIEKKLIGWSRTIGLLRLTGVAVINQFYPPSFWRPGLRTAETLRQSIIRQSIVRRSSAA